PGLGGTQAAVDADQLQHRRNPRRVRPTPRRGVAGVRVAETAGAGVGRHHRRGGRMSTYLQIADDEIMFVAPGVCPPNGVRTHICEGTFSYTGFVRTFKLAAVMANPDGRRET